jgi:hypothetical protein
MNGYPSWRYHKTLKALIVHSPEEDKNLGEGWADSPAAFTHLTDELDGRHGGQPIASEVEEKPKARRGRK